MTTGLEEMKDFTFCNKVSVEMTFFHRQLKIFQFMHHQYLHYGSDGSHLLFAAMAKCPLTASHLMLVSDTLAFCLVPDFIFFRSTENCINNTGHDVAFKDKIILTHVLHVTCYSYI